MITILKESYEDVSLTLIELHSSDNHITFRMDGYDWTETLDEILNDAIEEVYDESDYDYAWDNYCKIIEYDQDDDYDSLTTSDCDETLKAYVSDEILDWLDHNGVKYKVLENPKQMSMSFV